ncbi:hypothetical protein FVE85_3906 [Porphyridium purpureum]|uniref:Uncharacterized protein n=1 Tax=Porphyridium purpureum TaxID=35688 RepID=A0A5J4YR33_PORPP|nr:hypothetical protein FVE85_3906 [Porphyridium purpureum]|eukprot:POR8040..scf229_5
MRLPLASPYCTYNTLTGEARGVCEEQLRSGYHSHLVGTACLSIRIAADPVHTIEDFFLAESHLIKSYRTVRTRLAQGVVRKEIRKLCIAFNHVLETTYLTLARILQTDQSDAAALNRRVQQECLPAASVKCRKDMRCVKHKSTLARVPRLNSKQADA